MSLTKEKNSEIIKKFSKSDKDYGSTSVQVAIMTERIKLLTEHLKSNKKDQSTRRGLLKLVGKRKSLLQYLRSKNEDGYKSLIKDLGIRR
tara:strand:- start:282 stop:551 length:270 start_codon:yes stop_codon:yes gene_type:complete